MNRCWSPTRTGETSSSSPEMPKRRRSSCERHPRPALDEPPELRGGAGRARGAPLGVGGARAVGARRLGRCGRGCRRLGDRDVRGLRVVRGRRFGLRGDLGDRRRVRCGFRAHRDGGGGLDPVGGGAVGRRRGAIGRRGGVVRRTRAGGVRVGVAAVPAAPAHRQERRGLGAGAERSVMLGSRFGRGFPPDRRMIPRAGSPVASPDRGRARPPLSR